MGFLKYIRRPCFATCDGDCPPAPCPCSTLIDEDGTVQVTLSGFAASGCVAETTKYEMSDINGVYHVTPETLGSDCVWAAPSNENPPPGLIIGSWTRYVTCDPESDVAETGDVHLWLVCGISSVTGDCDQGVAAYIYLDPFNPTTNCGGGSCPSPATRTSYGTSEGNPGISCGIVTIG